MVLGLVRAGRKMADIRNAIEEENLLARYVERRREERKAHPLEEEIGALAEYIEWLRYSREGSLISSAPVEKRAMPTEAPVFRGKTTLPVASVGDMLRAPDRWAESHVIVEGGRMEPVSVNKRGEHWHVLSDGTGRITAVSDGALEHREGTLFGVARRTDAGKQLFIEVKNFYPLQQRIEPQEKRI
ncbi:MAG: hypothetical protein V1813_04040 [Candidatus Aenigmatarchaeota archaeon]